MAELSSEEAFESMIDGIARMPIMMASLWKTTYNIASDRTSKFFNPELAELAERAIKIYEIDTVT